MTRIVSKVRERFRRIGLLSERNPFDPLKPTRELFRIFEHLHRSATRP